MSDVRLLKTHIRLFRFDGEILEIFMPSDSTRYHVSLLSDVEINVKKKRLTFRYGLIPQQQMIMFEPDELIAVGEFMRDVVAAAPPQ